MEAQKAQIQGLLEKEQEYYQQNQQEVGFSDFLRIVSAMSTISPSISIDENVLSSMYQIAQSQYDFISFEIIQYLI